MDEKNVFDPLGIIDSTPCSSCPKYFTSAQCQIFLLMTLMRRRYLIKLPNTLPMTMLVHFYFSLLCFLFVAVIFSGEAEVVMSFMSWSLSLYGLMIVGIVADYIFYCCWSCTWMVRSDSCCFSYVPFRCFLLPPFFRRPSKFLHDCHPLR